MFRERITRRYKATQYSLARVSLCPNDIIATYITYIACWNNKYQGHASLRTTKFLEIVSWPVVNIFGSCRLVVVFVTVPLRAPCSQGRVVIRTVSPERAGSGANHSVCRAIIISRNAIIFYEQMPARLSNSHA